jgi:4-amino-4-deoxy-L-arabinose transferase-like glycosyltransferase
LSSQKEKAPSQSRFIIALVLIFLITRLPLLAYLPLVMDEAVYGIMIEAQVHAPTVVPTFLGYPMSWKPALFFWTASAFSHLPLPMEIAYRLPSFLFGLATIPIVFQILRKAGATDSCAFFSTAIFLLSMFTIYPNAAALIDSMMFFLISLAVLTYMNEEWGRKRFLLAAAIAFIAFFTKFILAAMIPVLAIAYFYFKRKETLRDRLFLLSLLAVPLAFSLNLALFQQNGLGNELVIPLGSNTVSPNGLQGQLMRASGAIMTLLLGGGIWAAISVPGFLAHWRKNLFMACWYALTIFPMLAGTYMIWYFLPVMPAIAYFAFMSLGMWKGQVRLDKLFYITFAMLAIASLGLASFLYYYLHEFNVAEKNAGLMLSGKENVLIIGKYPPTLVAYKYLTELKGSPSGTPKDFGWITSVAQISDERMAEYLADYHSGKFPIVDGTFSEFFTTNQTFRKDTNITRFDYVAVVGSNVVPHGCRDVLSNDSGIVVFGGCG